MISRSLGERMMTRMIRARMRMITTRKNITMQKIRTVVEGCVASLPLAWRAFLIVFMGKRKMKGRKPGHGSAAALEGIDFRIGWSARLFESNESLDCTKKGKRLNRRQK